MVPGDVIADRFAVVELASSGGMGAVFRAHDRRTGEEVALKTVYRQSAEDVERFAREAEVLAALAHPGIVRYIAHGSTDAGELYLAMEWLTGEDLSSRLARLRLTTDESVALASNVASALQAAHALGVVHRDIKPSNLFLVGGAIERVKILDFGIVHLGDAASPASARASTGAMFGTLGYMAPEQARGERTIDARADVFALGCVLFECLAGRPLFAGESPMAVLAKILLEQPPKLRDLRPDLPLRLDDLVTRMLCPEPAGRPRDGAAALAELGALGAVDGFEEPRPSRPPVTLTAGELRSICVILASAPGRGKSDPTVAEAATERHELRALIEKRGGRLESLADGSLVATLWGARAATDLVAQAARCALAMRAAKPSAPIALATGRGALAHRWPVGEVIDRAARLLAARADDDAPILIDEVTAGLLDARFDVSGGAAGLELRGEREHLGATRMLLGKPTPCVGRERELAVLIGIFEECIAEPVARAALVTGPAGVGKSRLRYELVREVQQRGEAVEVWICRGDPMSAGSAFGMLAGPLRRAAGVLEGEPMEVRRKKLHARVARNLKGADALRVAWFLGELVGAPFPDDESVELRSARQDPMLMGDQMRRAFEDFLAAECAVQPLLITLEDMHWGDLPSVTFLDAALRNQHERPWMVLGLARPEVHDLFPRLWMERGVNEIRLGQLTRKSSEKLVRAVLGEAVSAARVQELVDRSAGNAFYLEELIRAVAEGKGDHLPETVLTMVQSRLEELDPEARRVLRAASVFGQVFWRRGLAALLAGSVTPIELEGWLDRLVERELVSRRGEGKFAGEEELVFRHALVREAAYGMLTDEDRALGHRIAGQWLESVAPPEAMVLAEHLERGGEPGAAVAWYRRAAEQALEGNDLAAAVARAERGVACGAAGEVLGMLRLMQAEAALWRGDNAEGVRLALEAARSLPRGGAGWCRATGQAAVASERLGRFELSAELSEELRAAGPEATSTGAYAIACARVAMSTLVSGQPDRARPLLAEVDRLERELGPGDPIATAWIHRAGALRDYFAEDISAYLRKSEAVAKSFEEAGDIRVASLQRVNVGYAYLVLGAFAEAERALRELIARSVPLGLHIVTANAQHNLGMALARLGSLEQARDVETQALEALQIQRDRRLEAGSRMYLATIHALSGDLEAAEREARGAVAIGALVSSVHVQALATLAQVRLAQGLPREAAEIADQAMALADRDGFGSGEALLRLVHAEARRGIGDADGARAAILAAAARLRESASRISDPDLRESFLRRVPENARTLALAAEWDRGA